LLAGAAIPTAAYGQCVTDRFAVDACLGGVRISGPSLPPGMTLDLNFMNPGTLDPRITFTRASSATYTDASGVVRTAATNAPRWDYANGVLRGLLIEEQRTNVCLRSGDISNAVWLVASSVGSIVITGNNTIAPDGTMTAARVVYPACTTATTYSVIYQAFASAIYTASIWLKGAVGGEQIYLGLTDNGANKYRLRVTLTTAWQRFSVTAGVAAAYSFTLGTDLNDGGQTGTPGGTVYMWGAQVEAGAFPTSYIPTTSVSVTRAQDNCAIPAANMLPWFASPGGSWFAEFICQNPSPVNLRIIAPPDVSGGPSIMGTNSITPFSISQYDGASFVVAPTTALPNTIVKGVSTWAVGQAKIGMNGGAINSTAAETTGFPTALSTGVKFLTVLSAGGLDNMTGTIRRVTYWPRALSDTEMQQVTT
jgi:hypothetical protein